MEVAGCRDCPPPPVTSVRAAFLFEGPARRAVHRLKFAGWRDVARALSAAVAACPDLPEADVITWVPLARRRLAERGYDQARALAVGLAGALGLPAVKLLRRRVATGPQARRTAEQRREALRGAFVAIRRPPERVLLVDDVLTTGATVAACAQALVEGGGRDVLVAAAARALGGSALRLVPDRAYPRVGPRPGLWLPGEVPR
jgi:predicted amidophosphoribosyltransferase